MAYVPDYEPLPDALKRVMATGMSQDEAKADLCRAVADRKIVVRVRIAGTDEVFYAGNVGVPPHLKPGDLDWFQSRPFKRWAIGPRPGEHYFWNWKDQSIDLVELSTRDVVAVLCNGENAQARQQQRRRKSRPAIERAQEAIKALYPTGVPDQKTESNKILSWNVNKHLKQLGLREVSEETVLRAAERRK